MSCGHASRASHFCGLHSSSSSSSRGTGVAPQPPENHGRRRRGDASGRERRRPSNLSLAAGTIAVPRVGFGLYKTAPEETKAAVALALEAGVRHFDTAAAYNNEGRSWAALRWKGDTGENVFVASKIAATAGALREGRRRGRRRPPQARAGLRLRPLAAGTQRKTPRDLGGTE